MKTPVIFIIFNRPDLTRRSFAAIRQAQPETLIVVADGPRSHRPGEAGQCAATRDIIDQVDWPCQVIKEYADVNLGCKNRVASGITAAFQRVDRAIILEDDCLPEPTFFTFCETMLDYYATNEQVMAVSGNNFLFKRSTDIQDSYYFSQYVNIWGWATWKRAWDKYDVTMSDWPIVRDQHLFNQVWTKRFDLAHANKIDTWDIQWTYTCLRHHGLTVVPKHNLVSNVGFARPDATHTKVKTIVAEMDTQPMIFPLQHPTIIAPNTQADKQVQFHFTRIGLVIDMIKMFFKRI